MTSPRSRPTEAQINTIQGWCPDCGGCGMVMEFDPTDCPNLDLHRLLAAIPLHDERRVAQ